jgi:hypothetical protein
MVESCFSPSPICVSYTVNEIIGLFVYFIVLETSIQMLGWLLWVYLNKLLIMFITFKFNNIEKCHHCA